MITSAAPRCSLCTAPTFLFDEDSARRYFRCSCCRLVLADPQSRLTRDAEKRHYDFHQNDPCDARYRQFLNRLFEPLQGRLAPRCRGLDFGSGPGPTLSLMFAQAGHSVQIYDPFYAPDQSVLQGKYDFITASEVVEHLHHPGKELVRLWSLLELGGWLGIMTKRVGDLDAFRSWHYKLDPTHVSFFCVETFAWLADRLSAHYLVVSDDVVLLQKPLGR